ncbi:MAG: HEAT repeat domain-containing protein [Fischerella sp.]|uniref:HEAT repeat domain-containing protein n=1 Tax=Fischerella sp. TaxID=1191 RepID=UPI0018013F30|nr:HEAT repeat domain-containing protein [Fischerella sp.]NWF58922.1 HEAT repeat domain-containing protein [Fischerella sp.]
MNKLTSPKFPTQFRFSAVVSQMVVGLFCLSSPLVVASATWAQQSSELPQTNSPNVSVSVPLQGNNSQPSVNVTPSGNLSPAIPALIQVLQGKQPQAGFDAASAIPVLIQGLQGNNPQLRADATSAIPGIIQAMQGQSPQVQPNAQPQAQSLATDAGRCAGSNTASVVPGLVQALQNQDGLVRFFAAAVLGCIGEQAKGAVPTLISSLTDPDQSVRLVAAFALDKIGVGLQQAAKTLSTGELNQLISSFDSALKIVSDPLLKFPQDAVNSLFNPLQILQQEQGQRR